MKKSYFKMFAILGLIAGISALTSCNTDEDKDPVCATPDLSNIFIVTGGQSFEMTSTGSSNFEYSIVNFEQNTFSFVFANNATANNATYGIALNATSTPTTGIAVQKVVDGTVTCGENAPLALSDLQGKNITISFNTTTLAFSITSVDFNPCTDFSRDKFFIRWRNTTNAGDFSWSEMTKVADQEGVFEITQPASNFYLADADVPNFGAQILEFSNQPDYGGLNNGEFWPLYRNRNDNSSNGFGFWTFEKPVNGVSSKIALFVSVSTRDASGTETVVCPKPDDVDRAGGFRLLLSYDGESIIQKTNTLRYVIDTFSGEVAVFIQ